MVMELKAKVLLVSEEQMEIEDKYDLGDIAKSKEWVWRSIGVPVEEVYRITEYTKSKTVVQMYDGEKVLVLEPFKEVFEKWRDLKITAGQWEEDKKEEDDEQKEDDGG